MGLARYNSGTQEQIALYWLNAVIAQGHIWAVIRDQRRSNGVGPQWVPRTGLEPVSPACKAGVLTRLDYRGALGNRAASRG